VTSCRALLPAHFLVSLVAASLSELAAQGNVDPMVLFADEKAIAAAVRDCVAKAGERGHILNLGYGVTVGTPEENVKYMFDLSKTLTYKSAAGVA